MEKLNITLLVGGSSTERIISKATSKNIYKALKDLGHNVTLIDPTYGINQPNDVELFFADNDFAEVRTDNYIAAFGLPIFDNTDLVFNGLHGKFGEDGTIQSLLEIKKLKYTGSGTLASALAMDKCASKALFKHFDVNTAEWIPVSSKKIDINSIKKEIEERIFYPCIVKPNDQGSTIGLSVCNKPDEVEDAINLALKYSDKALIESFIDGFELTVGILDDIVLPPLEIKPKNNLYDYECKYTDNMSIYIVPAEMPADILNKLQEQALLAYKALECSSYGRVDFRVDKNYNIYCLEVNTLPGMTSHSLLPMMASAIGINFNQMIDRIIKNSI
jgi:D-alanine-D-alanine ligase